MLNNIIKGFFVILACALVFGYVVKEQKTQHKKLDKKQEQFDQTWKSFDQEFDSFLKDE